jgi:MFS family permease
LDTTTTDSCAPIRYGELLRGNANFRFLWFGETVSWMGDWFNLVASASLIAALTESGLAVGTLFVVRLLAPFLVSPIAGVVADRYNRKHILVLSDVTRAVTVCGFLLIRDARHVWLLYALTAIQLGISGFFVPARNAMLPNIVPARGLGTAIAISGATWSIMLTLGAALGGIVAGTFGIYPAFVVDSVGFLLSAFLIAQMRLDTAPDLEASDRTIGAVLREYLEGLRYLIRHVNILVTTSHKSFITGLLGATFEVVQVAISERVFVIGEGGSTSLGLMFGVTGIGTAVGPLVARHLVRDRPRPLRLTISLAYLLGGLGLALTATLVNFEMMLVGTLLRGIGNGIAWVFSTQLLLQLVPDHVRGRVTSTEFATSTLVGAAGAAMVGRALDSSLGISGVAWWMAALTLIPAALWALWVVRGKSAEPAPEDEGIRGEYFRHEPG